MASGTKCDVERNVLGKGGLIRIGRIEGLAIQPLCTSFTCQLSLADPKRGVDMCTVPANAIAGAPRVECFATLQAQSFPGLVRFWLGRHGVGDIPGRDRA